MKKLILISLIVVLNYSCKENKDSSVEKTPIEEQITPKYLTVDFSFKTNKSDVFRILLNNIKVDELQKKNINIFERVDPSNEFDRIVAKFDMDNISNNLIINLGNKEQKEIKINTIEFIYGENSMLITKANFNKYLRVNQFIDYDNEKFSISTKSVKGKHNPSIFARKTLIAFLKKETTN